MNSLVFINILGLLFLFIVTLLIIIKIKTIENRNLQKIIENLYNIIKENNQKSSPLSNKLSELQELKKKLERY